MMVFAVAACSAWATSLFRSAQSSIGPHPSMPGQMSTCPKSGPISRGQSVMSRYASKRSFQDMFSARTPDEVMRAFSSRVTASSARVVPDPTARTVDPRIAKRLGRIDRRDANAMVGSRGTGLTEGRVAVNDMEM